MRLASILTTTRLVGHGDLQLRSSLRRSCRSATDASEIRRTLRPGSFPLKASIGIVRSVSSPHTPPSPLIPRTISVRAAAGGGAGSGGGRKGKRRQGKKGRQQQEPGSTENVSVTAAETPTEHESEGSNDSDKRSEDSSSGGSGSDSSAANAARRRKPKGAPKGPAARRWSFEQLMAVWDSQFQRVSACASGGGSGAPTALDIARVAAAGQQRFGRGCVLVQVHVRAKLRGSAAGFGAGPGAAGMGKRGAGKGKGGAKGKGNSRRKGEGEWEEPTTQVLETSVEYVPRGMLLLEDDDRWGIMEESEETGDAAGDSETTDAPTVEESRAAGAGGATGAGGDTGRAGVAGEVGEVGVEVPVVSQGDLTGLVRCAGDSSRLLQLTAPTTSSSSSDGVGGTNAGSAHEGDVFDAELVEGGRKTEEIGGNKTGGNAFQLADVSAGGMPEWGGEAPYDEHRGEFVLVLWLHMDGQAVAGADVVRACAVGNPEGLCSLVEFAGVRWEGDEVKLVVRDMEGVEEEEEAELEIV